MYIVIKQFKHLVVIVCNLYYKATGRAGFEYTLSSKLISLIFSLLTLVLKAMVLYKYPEVGLIYVRIINYSDIWDFGFSLQVLHSSSRH